MKLSNSSPGFLYCVGLVVTIIVTSICLVSLIPISIAVIYLSTSYDRNSANIYIEKVNDWTNTGRMKYLNIEKVKVSIDIGDEFDSTSLDTSFKFVNDDIKYFNIPDYKGYYFEASDIELYKDVKFTNDNDKTILVSYNIKTASDGEDKKTKTNIPIFKHESRRNDILEGPCLGKTKDQTCDSYWRLTGICSLTDEMGKNFAVYESLTDNGSNGGCSAGPNDEWLVGVYGEQVKENETYTQKGKVVLRSKYDPAVYAYHYTDGKSSFITYDPMKKIIGIVLLSGCGVTVIVALFTICIATCCFIQAKRMDQQYKYQEISQEANAIFDGEDETISSVSEDDNNNPNRRYRGDVDTI